VVRRKRKGKLGKWVGRVLTAALVLPALYLAAALVGALVPVNAKWREPANGTTVYLADNGIHADILMPVRAQGLDWSPLIPRRDFAALPDRSEWIAFGSGERHVYLDTPTWSQIRPRTVWAALTGGPRVIHVEYSPAHPMPFDRSGSGRMSIAACGQPSAPTSNSTRRGNRSGSGMRATVRRMPSTGQPAGRMRCAPAMPSCRTG